MFVQSWQCRDCDIILLIVSKIVNNYHILFRLLLLFLPQASSTSSHGDPRGNHIGGRGRRRGFHLLCHLRHGNWPITVYGPVLRQRQRCAFVVQGLYNQCYHIAKECLAPPTFVSGWHFQQLISKYVQVCTIRENN